METTYSSKSNARRAATRQSLENYELVKNEEGRWYPQVVENDFTPANVDVQARIEAIEEKPTMHIAINTANLRILGIHENAFAFFHSCTTVMQNQGENLLLGAGIAVLPLPLTESDVSYFTKEQWNKAVANAHGDNVKSLPVLQCLQLINEHCETLNPIEIDQQTESKFTTEVSLMTTTPNTHPVTGEAVMPVEQYQALTDAVNNSTAEVAQAQAAIDAAKATEEPNAEEISALTEAHKTAKIALKEAEKALKAADREISKTVKAAEREAAKATKAAEREAKKAAKAAEKLEAQMPIQNDMRMPKPGTKTRAVWDKCDELSRQHQRPPTRKEILAVCEGSNVNMVSSQYAYWRKFHGVTGRIVAPNKPEPVAEATAETAETAPVAEAS